MLKVGVREKARESCRPWGRFGFHSRPELLGSHEGEKCYALLSDEGFGEWQEGKPEKQSGDPARQGVQWLRTGW